MKVRDLDVTQVNSKYIFAKDNVRIKTTKQFLDDIIVTAQENVLFYSRMFQEVKEQGDKLIAEVVHAAYGFCKGMTYALARKEEAYKLYNQASAAMKEVA